MLNRTLQVKMVKSNKEDAALSATTEISLENKLALAGFWVERAIVKAGKVALAYVAVDTIRQVVVARAIRK